MSQNDTDTTIDSALVDSLRLRATEIAQHAYAPYSGFRVGAALLLDGGHIAVGCNVENASYRLTICAEQAAIASAVAQHGPHIHIQTVVVVDLNDAASQPCGACRQTISEFSSADTQVYFQAGDGSLVRSSAGELLPHAFVLAEQRMGDTP